MPQARARAEATARGGARTGPHPSPAQILTRLEHTAQPLGGAVPNSDYGYGLVDAGAATAPTAGPARHAHARIK